MSLALCCGISEMPPMPSFGIYYGYRERDYYTNSKIISICWAILDVEGRTLSLKYYKIDGQLGEILDFMLEDMKKYDVKRLVGHNLLLHYAVLLSEAYELGHPIEKALHAPEHFCTMREGARLMNRWRPVKLCALYFILFKKHIQGQLTEASDVLLSVIRCYVVLAKLAEARKSL